MMINYSILGYALASSLILFFLWITYRLIFASKVKPSVNRVVILAIFIFSALLPLWWFNANSTSGSQYITIGHPIVANVLVEKTNTIFKPAISHELFSLFTGIYFSGVAIMICFTIFSFIKLLKLKRISREVIINGKKIYIHGNQYLSTFSWFNFIFIYKDSFDTDANTLLLHEEAHVNYRHWADICIYQLALIFLWFNPTIWWLKRELQQVHEYQADHTVIESGIEKKNYQKLLIRNVKTKNVPGLVNGFNNCSLKKRLLMMKKTQFKSNIFGRTALLLSAAVAGVMLIQIPVVANVLQTSNKKLNLENIILLNKNFEDIIYRINNEQVSYEKIKNLDADQIDFVEVFKGKESTIAVVLKDPKTSENNSSTSEKFNNEQKIKSMIMAENEVPTYENGEDQLKKDLTLVLHYPISTYENNFEGIVNINFTVTKEGETKNFKIINSLGSELDLEAINALKDITGKWLPAKKNGHPIDSEITVGVFFSLEY